MNINFFMPTRIIMGEDCIYNNRAVLQSLGKKALIMCGKNSAKNNGSLADIVKALEANGQQYFLHDKVMSNPTLDCVYEAAEAIKREGCDFVAALGGGSPMDASKAAACLALNWVDKSAFFGTSFNTALPIVAVPTTAGTGSEVTPYAIITNDQAQTKTNIGSPALFPRYAFLDAKYMLGLSREITINTAVDALSHAVEGILSVKASPITDTLARESIAVVSGSFPTLLGNGEISLELRQKLLYGATLGGMVIAHTGTTAVHSIGYSLTYYNHIDHGRANGLVFAEFLRVIEAKEKSSPIRRIPGILSAMGLKSIDEFDKTLSSLIGKKEKFGLPELEKYAEQAMQAKNIANCIIKLDKGELLEILKKSIG
ncbi:alcohol dehydrogenase, iron-dependent [Treponema primitia ZAS-2]|uniref:Alcohol dehydrogenase, iron-dependent n=1 Tax=Treponema primitia (strain ATCC BAA-887 / DSM 12427 / ZAS-2) TaxID=545694 RepID=F5YM82_TREPZ|nr:iron-containing alcohol dehydrogenase family protein [Treponema primitia]AEF83685.1 alcohol dehydrogenase, iron-dependent [Treponema primitia ZAS-2]